MRRGHRGLMFVCGGGIIGKRTGKGGNAPPVGGQAFSPVMRT